MKWWASAAVVVGACGSAGYALLPAQPVQPASTALTMPIRGVIHVHTRRSDGTGTVEEIAASAARAGLQFVIITDHGDGTRGADAPAYHSGVLTIDAVEIGTEGGHIVALDLPPSPYPLGGELRDVLEDVQRVGAMAIAAHPDSARSSLRWTDWNAPVDGLEWLNGDSQWRDEGWGSLGRALLTYPVRPTATLTALLDGPRDLLKQWDLLNARRRVVGVAASDAHARLGIADRGGYSRVLAMPVPSYEALFRTLSISLPDVQPSGGAADDARAVLDAIRRGKLYSSVDGLASPAALTFVARIGADEVGMGEESSAEGPLEIRAESNAPPGAQLVLIRDGEVIGMVPAQVLEHRVPEGAGVYRVEVRLPGSPGTPPVPWIVSNPVYVGRRTVAESPKAVQVVSARSLYTDGPATGWRLEKSQRSDGAIDVVSSVGGTQVAVRYGLGGARSDAPYVAAVVPLGPSPEPFERIAFTARASHPLRMSVQLRVDDNQKDLRWRRSVYLDQSARMVVIAAGEMTPVGEASGPPPINRMRDLLFVIDTVNTELGTNGQIWLDDVQLVR
jgi:hypothetical protein